MNTEAGPAGFRNWLLLTASGGLIWAAHFAGVYGFTGLACERGGQALVLIVVLVATAVALAVIGAITARNLGHSGAWRAADETIAFLRWTSIGLGLLAAVAVLWTAVAAVMVPACGS